MPEAVVQSGLEGIVVAETEISEVDGEGGRLIIRGFEAETLAETLSFEESCYLLWTGNVPDDAAKNELYEKFGNARAAAFDRLTQFQKLPAQPKAMDALRTFISTFPGTADNNIDEYISLTAATAVFLGNWINLKDGRPLVAPDVKLHGAADVLRMMTGKKQRDDFAKALDTYLTVVSDHGMNASTFTARVVASTASDNVSCVVAAIGALKGPLHGGAPGPVLKMLSAIGTPEKAEEWLLSELKSGRRIMGMGHRIYRVRDPRSSIFESVVAKLEKSGTPAPRLALARAVEKTAERILAERHPERPLKANVEFFTAVLLDTIGIPDDLFSPAFAAGRVAGWCAHIKEQRALNRLIRPGSKYVGGYR